MTPFFSASAQIANSNAPAAPSRWPVIDFVEPKISFRACSPNTAFTAALTEPAAVLVDGPARSLGLVVALGPRFHFRDACDREGRHRRLGPAGHHDVGLVVADQLEGVAQRVCR